MYTTEQNRKLQEKTKNWQAHISNPEYVAKHLEELRDVLRFHEYRYYIMDDPLISDGEYDHLYKALEKAEEAHPELATTDSPTMRVAPSLTTSFKTVQHLVPMLSLENSYNADDL